MLNLQDPHYQPVLEEIGQYVQNPVFMQFCSEIKKRYHCAEKIEYSSCSLAKGWNVKFKKAGRALCALYPQEQFFHVMVVVGRREKEAVEALLPEFTPELQGIYRQADEWNGQRWLTIPLEDQNRLYEEVFRLIQIRRES